MDQQRKMYRYLAKSSQHVGEAGDTKPYMGALQVTRLTHVRAWVRRGFNTCVKLSVLCDEMGWCNTLKVTF